MKAKIMNVLNINEPEKILFGVKITGLRRPLFVGISGQEGFFESTHKNAAIQVAYVTNKWIALKGQALIDKLKENKDIVMVKVDMNEFIGEEKN